MSLSQDHNNLFRRSDVSDKLSLLQSLLDSKDLTPVQAIALLNNIRVELETPQTNRSSVYRRYAQIMESLRREMPEIHEEVVHAWETKKANLQAQQKPSENLIGSQSGVDQESSLENPFGSPAGYRQPLENPSKHLPEKANNPESKETSSADVEERFEEGEAEHSELEDEHEEHESEEQLESEQEEKDEELEEAGEEQEAEEPEEREERNEAAEEEERETEEHEESKAEIEEADENEEVEVEKEELETGEELEVESEESPEKGKLEAEAGAEPERENHMATEAAEAAEHMETEEVELTGEEEPPIEAGE